MPGERYQPPPNGFRTFLIVWASQSVSVIGSALTLFALNIWLAQTLYPRPEQKPQLAWALSAISLCFALPAVFGAPLAGAFVDRHDRKRVMMLMDFASGALTLITALLVMSGRLNIGLLLVVIVLSSAFGALHFAAFDASFAMLVPEEKLARANGMMQTAWSFSGVLSPALAAALIGVPALARQGHLPVIFASLGTLHDGAALAMLVDSATFILAAITLLFLTIPSPTRVDLAASNTRKPSLLQDVREGALYIWHRRPMLWLLGTFAVVNFLQGPVGVLEPMLVKFTLAPDWIARGMTFESALATLGTGWGLGGVLGGLAISVWGGLRRRRVYGVVVPMIFGAIGFIILGRIPLLTVAAAMYFVNAATLPITNAHSQAIWQTQTPRELQGRVFSVRRLIAQFSWPLSTALAGWLGAAFDPGAVVSVLGLLLLLFSVAQTFNRRLLQVEDKVALDAMAARALLKGV